MTGYFPEDNTLLLCCQGVDGASGHHDGGYHNVEDGRARCHHLETRHLDVVATKLKKQTYLLLKIFALDH